MVFESVSAWGFKLLTTGLFWLVAVFVLIIGSFGGLWLRKRKRLQYPALIHFETGGGKGGYINSKAGWFKSKTFLFGLWDYGKEEYLKLKDGRKVQGASTEDFHEINGKKGIVCVQKEDDNNILVPITKTEIVNKKLLMQISPKEFRDASVDIIKQAENETRNRLEQVMQWVMLGGVIVFALIAIILITQMVQRGQTEAAELIKEAGRITVTAARSAAP